MLSVRTVTTEDRELLNAAAEADPYHKAAGLTGEYWLEDTKNTLFYEDADGPVVALKTTNVARVDVQFLTQDRARNARALEEGFWTYVRVLQSRNVKELIFNTESPAVAKFFSKRFGFRELGNGTYSLRIANDDESNNQNLVG